MNAEVLILNRLQLQTVKRELYNITKIDIDNIKALKQFIKNEWTKTDDYKKYQIIQLLGGNIAGKGKNLKLIEQYIKKQLNHEIA